MIEGETYFKVIKELFAFLISDFGMELIQEKERGNAFYHTQYGNKDQVISISYENIEDYLQIIVFMLENGELPDYDDKTKTLHLGVLNKEIMPKVSKEDMELNAKHFLKFNAKSNIEQSLLKGAKALRLCLKRFNEINVPQP